MCCQNLFVCLNRCFQLRILYLMVNVLFHSSEIPDAPEGPVKIEDITKDSVKLSWQPPSKDGGSPITGYLIEQRDTRRSTWAKAGTVDKDTTTFKPSRLVEDNEYIFRIVAENAEGPSQPLESAPVKVEQPKCEYLFEPVLYETSKSILNSSTVAYLSYKKRKNLVMLTHTK